MVRSLFTTRGESQIGPVTSLMAIIYRSSNMSWENRTWSLWIKSAFNPFPSRFLFTSSSFNSCTVRCQCKTCYDSVRHHQISTSNTDKIGQSISLIREVNLSTTFKLFRIHFWFRHLWSSMFWVRLYKRWRWLSFLEGSSYFTSYAMISPIIDVMTSSSRFDEQRTKSVKFEKSKNQNPVNLKSEMVRKPNTVNCPEPPNPGILDRGLRI